MKHILAIAVLVTAAPSVAQVSVFDHPGIDWEVTQQKIEQTGPLFYQPTIEFPSSETFAFGGDSVKEVRAAEYILVHPGEFVAGPYTDGEMVLTVDPPPFDVVVMDGLDLGAVPKYEKLELGVELPPDILAQVENFMADSSVNTLNPYLEWELKVEAVFSHQNFYLPESVDGFYTREFTSWMVDPLPDPLPEDDCSDAVYATLGGYDEVQENPYPFRIRFAPPFVGDWQCYVKITVNGTTTITTPPFMFRVVQSGNHGFMKTGAAKRYMTLEGNTFVPIGANAPWPETEPRIDHDMAWATHIVENNAPKFIGESYRRTHAAPRVYDKYKERLLEMRSHGANYFRTIMYPSSTDIEWEKKGDYTQRLHMAQEMDEILELAEDNDFFLHWNLQIHFSFQTSQQAYWKSWTWTDRDPSVGREFSYRSIVGDDPFDFFTNEEAKKYYKQRLRYILARWGYSPNIAVFELFSEISAVVPGGQGGNSYYLTDSLSNWTTYRDWQVEMGNYIKSSYNGRKHLLTCSFPDRKHRDDDVFYYDCFDIMTSNMYDFDKPDWSGFWTDIVSQKQASLTNDLSYNKIIGNFGYNIKPLMYSETGVEKIHEICPQEKIERNRNMWYALFSGVSSLQWSLWYDDENFEILGQMRDFIEGIDLDGETWHPGASKLAYIPGFPPGWVYSSGFASDMQGTDKQADIAYLRSGDGNFAIGMVTNKTFNAKNINLCSIPNDVWPWSTDEEDNPILKQDTVDPQHEGLKVRGLNFDRYYINYFLPSDLSTPIHSDDNVGPVIPIRIDITPSASTYIVLFTVRRDGQNWIQQRKTTEMAEKWNDERLGNSFTDDERMELETNTVKIYPNPAKEHLFVDVNNSWKEARIILLSTEGRLIFSKRMQGFSEIIDISALAPGQYNIVLEKENYGKVYRKFVKL